MYLPRPHAEATIPLLLVLLLLGFPLLRLPNWHLLLFLLLRLLRLLLRWPSLAPPALPFSSWRHAEMQ